jgi:hypothetical protein
LKGTKEMIGFSRYFRFFIVSTTILATTMSSVLAGSDDGRGKQVSASDDVHVAVDERDVRTLPVNYFRFGQTAEEVILDAILQMPNPNPNPDPQNAYPGKTQVLLKVQDRLVLSYPAAKRLEMQLSQLIKRYEQQFGEIPLQPVPHNSTK